MSYSQSQSQCDNSDFFFQNFNGWNGFTGGCCPIVANTPGLVPGRHTIISAPGVDPNTCGGLQILPPGVPQVARLGDSNVGAEAERLRYTIPIVTPGNALFIYSFAVVLESPGHSCSEQPRFQVKVTNAAGNVIDPNCASYNYASGGCGTNQGNFSNCNGVEWQNWQTAALDLTPYLNQSINIDFSTGDCDLGGHFGYAYLYGSCQALVIDVAYCAGSNQVVLTGPPGFAQYQWWKTAQPNTILGNSQSLSVSNPVIGDQYTCKLTTFAGCQILLNCQIQPSIVNADYDFTTACAGEIVNFYDLSNVNNSQISSWLWDFGDGGTSNLQNPTHSFATGGVYNVRLIAGSNAGCSDTIIQQVTVTPRPTAQFTVNNSCVGTPATFVNTTPNANVLSFNWSFGINNAVSLAQSPSFTYPASGTFPVTLMAADANGCRDTLISQITVNPVPHPDFTVPNICVGVPVTFTDASASLGGAITNVTWNFGPGQNAVGNTATHTFNSVGVANVVITATDANNCVNDSLVLVTINRRPTPFFNGTTECLGNTTLFTDGSSSTNGGIVSWHWDFGTGNPADTANVQNTGFVFPASGDFSVQLSVTDAIGCQNSYTGPIHVGNIPVADFSIINPQDRCLGQTLYFLNSSSSSVDALNGFVWNFGVTPAVTSGATNPNFTYLSEGQYTIVLTTSTVFNCVSAPDSLTIYVNPIPTPGFTSTEVCAGFPTDFTNTSTVTTGQIVSYDWILSQFPYATDVVQDPSYTYMVGGTYQVTLTAETDSGCSATIQQPILVYPDPIANFSSTTICQGFETDFTALGQVAYPDNLVGFDWDFNAGEGLDTGNAEQHPRFIFGSHGTKPVTLEVTTNHGCVSDTTIDVLVYSKPVTDFTFTNVCAGFPISFTNNSTNADGPLNPYWSFGTPFINFPYNTQANPTVTYNTAGPYQVILSTASSHGCVNRDTQMVSIYPIPLADFVVDPSCLKSPALFVDYSTVSNLFSDVIDTWSWDFGDGPTPGTSTLQNPSYYYSNFGAFSVNLEVTTNHGCVNDVTKNAIVYPIPQVDFICAPACSTHQSVFFNTTQMPFPGHVDSWSWDFGEAGASSTDSFPTHLYQTAGTFTVTLEATTDDNCVIDTTKDVIVNPLPVVSFTTDTIEGCQPLEVTLSDLITNPTGYTVDFWHWNFGDAHFSDDPSRATNIYDSYGLFDAQLILTTSDGCQDSLTLNDLIDVWPKPIADFAVDPQPTTELDAWITFTDLSTLFVTKWDWDFGVRDSINDVSTIQNPIYLYPDSGTYHPTLIVENRFGCRDTVTRPTIIRPDFVFYIPNSFTPQDGRDDLNETFNGYGVGIKSYEMRIYNRWGETVYKSENPKLGWDGKLRNSGDLAKQDVYVYVFEITDVHNRFHIYRGHVTLVRSK
ncbi:MAG: PKD domain-containing protein [Bacteroidia bacterium]|nr:PKD domain-containing protein [Bacteroidia bacterium]